MTRTDGRESGDPEVALGVLGGLEVRHGGETVSVGHARQRSVLAVLAVEAGRVVAVDTLIDRVWGERPPSRARSTLRTYLTHLRRALAPSGVAITHRNGGYLLAAGPHLVDLHRFHQLLTSAREQQDPERALDVVEKALELWRDEPLAELDTPWAQAVRNRLHLEHAAAEADRADWALRCGRHHELLPELTARAEAQLLDERVAGQLMLALYRAGRQVDALAHYQHVRQRLVEELGTDPGPVLQDLHQRILTADPTLTLTETSTTTGTGGSPAVPRQLPAPPRWFTGRTDHLAALTTALDHPGTVVISAIGGAGGIGKTWLALAWAHRHIDRFPDGQLFVDLRGFSPDSTPTDPAVALRGFLDALGALPDRIPADPEAQAALYRSLIVERRMLIVLDNAATVEQVVPLLPGSSSCTVLVTSRNRLHGLTARHGAHPVSLGMLTAAESRALLVATLGADRVAADDHATAELIALCGGFPLALGLIAARTQPHLPLADAVAELRESVLDALDDTDDPAASLPAVMSWSLRGLTTEQRHVFALLGIAPGPDIGLPAAISLTGLSVAKVRMALHALENASLLDRNPGGRYAMHDLVRDYAATTAHGLTKLAQQSALERIFDFYLHTAHDAYRRLAPSRDPIPLPSPSKGVTPLRLGSTRADAMRWFDTERLTLFAIQRSALDQRSHDQAWKLALIFGKYLLRRGLLNDNLTTWRLGHTASLRSADPNGEVTALRGLGLAYSHTGSYDDALVHLRRSLRVAPDATHRTHTHYALAEAALRHHDVDRGFIHAQHAVHGYRQIEQPVRMAAALALMGELHNAVGNNHSAESYCTQALSLQQQHNDHTGQASTLTILGTVVSNMGHHQAALKHHTEALTLFRETDNTHQSADTLEHVARTHATLDQLHQARAGWQEALKLYRQQGRDEDAKRVRQQLDALHDTRTTTQASTP